MFCWPCIIVHQYNETNVMCFSFNLLRIKDLYMFRALLTHPQEALQKQHLLYCARIMLVGCGAPQPTNIKLNEKCITLVSLYWKTDLFIFHRVQVLGCQITLHAQPVFTVMKNTDTHIVSWAGWVARMVWMVLENRKFCCLNGDSNHGSSRL
jgi:hypothetical protein